MRYPLADAAPRRTRDLAPWLLLAGGLGIAAGFLLGELVGAGGHHRLRRLIGRRGRAGAARKLRAGLAARVRDALAADPSLSGLGLDARLTPAGAVELRGWVPNRVARARAYRIGREVATGHEVINRVLVRGEDEIAPTLLPDDAPRSA